MEQGSRLVPNTCLVLGRRSFGTKSHIVFSRRKLPKLPKVRLNIFDAQLPEVLELRVREAQKAEKTVCELTDEIL